MTKSQQSFLSHLPSSLNQLVTKYQMRIWLSTFLTICNLKREVVRIPFFLFGLKTNVATNKQILGTLTKKGLITVEHVRVRSIGYRENMRWHFSSPFASIHVHHSRSVYGIPTVRVDSHTKKSRICLKK